MYVQLLCKDRNEKEMNELYEVLGALCQREGIQIEDRGASVEILACPQGKIVVTEDDKTMYLTANTPDSMRSSSTCSRTSKKKCQANTN